MNKTNVYCDLFAKVLHISKNYTFYSHSKHIDVCYHWKQEVLADKFLQPKKGYTDENQSDMMTKELPTKKFENCCKSAGVMVPN